MIIFIFMKWYDVVWDVHMYLGMNANTNQEGMKMTTGQKIEQSMSAHFCLKHAWNEFKTKDPVDAYYNALTLVQACKERMDAAQSPLSVNQRVLEMIKKS